MIRFAALAGENLDVAGPLIDRLAQPIEVDKEVVGGYSPPLEIFAIAVAATLTLAFVTVLLVAGSLALEREENAFPRLTRGLVSPAGAARARRSCSGSRSASLVTLLMLAGLQIFVPLEWGRFGLWLAAIVAGGAALGAAGAALGAAAREVRAVSLLAFMVTLPIAFLSLVPSGAVGKGLYDAIRVVVAALPLQAGAGSDDRGARLGRARRSAGRSSTWRSCTVAYAADRPPRPAPLRRGLSHRSNCHTDLSTARWGMSVPRYYRPRGPESGPTLALAGSRQDAWRTAVRAAASPGSRLDSTKRSRSSSGADEPPARARAPRPRRGRRSCGRPTRSPPPRPRLAVDREAAVAADEGVETGQLLAVLELARFDARSAGRSS